MDPRDHMLTVLAQLDDVSYYELLQVRPGADRATLQQGFHQFALTYHPDQHLDEEEASREAAKKIFERGVEAYTVLRDPDFARFYAERLAQGSRRLEEMDFEQFARSKRTTTEPPPRPTKSPPSPENIFIDSMQTEDGRTIAERVERLIREQRYREAYLQIGLLETVEGNNPAVQQRADKIASYLKRFGSQ